jgi:hypothetical protein
VQFGTAQP